MDYIYHQSTLSLCPHCQKPVPAKIIVKNTKVYLDKYCLEHNSMTELLEEDAEYYLKEHLYNKPGTSSSIQTKLNKGCPFDCGLCPDHEQHSCIGLIEVTGNCDLKCPTCYANSGKGRNLSLKQIDRMMDFFQKSENGEAELLQISGGEPTTHPQILEIIALAKSKKFKHIMLNTNGLRIASDPEFAQKLSQFVDGFEIYLQFDGIKDQTYQKIRNRSLIEIKKQAIATLSRCQVPITLVATVIKGVNDHELGDIFAFGIDTPMVRGINYQPLALFGRFPKSLSQNRITLTGIINQLEKQTNGVLRKCDFIPLPCHPERVAFTYLYRTKEGFFPITRKLNAQKYLPLIKNTFTFKPEDFLEQMACDFGKGCSCFNFLKDLHPLIPFSYTLKSKKEKFKYINENTFRVTLSSFIDAYNFEMKAMKKECVHIITPDLKRIPFSSYNMIHRQKYA